MNRFRNVFQSSLAFALCLLLVMPETAWSWGKEGHRVVARIAARNLSTEARQKIAVILGTTPSGVDAAMAKASTWPDEINKQATMTGNWHFVDVSVTAPFAIGNLCANHDCVIDRIQEMSDRLRLNQTGFALATAPIPSRAMTSQELAFLIHLVGDIHQPLHAATDGDRGGNCVNLTAPLKHADGSEPTTELHAAWDVDEVLSVFKILGNETMTASKLFQRFKNGTAVTQLTIADWAREANALAKKDIYDKLHLPNHTAAPGQCAPGIASITITQDYLDKNESDVEQQLLRAGIRLSNVLNNICTGTGCAVKPK